MCGSANIRAMRTRRIASLARRFAVPLAAACLFAAVLVGAVGLLTPPDGGADAAALPVIELPPRGAEAAAGPEEAAPGAQADDLGLTKDPATGAVPTAEPSDRTTTVTAAGSHPPSGAGPAGAGSTASSSVAGSTSSSTAGAGRQVVEEELRVDQAWEKETEAGPATREAARPVRGREAPPGQGRRRPEYWAGSGTRQRRSRDRGYLQGQVKGCSSFWWRMRNAWPRSWHGVLSTPVFPPRSSSAEQMQWRGCTAPIPSTWCCWTWVFPTWTASACWSRSVDTTNEHPSSC